MSKCQMITDFPYPNIIILFIFLFFLPLESVVTDVEQNALRYIATKLLPNECQSIIEHKVERSPDNLPTNGIDCFRKLVGWTSNLRINRRDVNLILGNRLHKIGRDDLAAWNGIHNHNSFKDNSLVMIDPDSNRLATPAADGATVITTVQNQQPEEHGGSSTVKGNVDKNVQDSKNKAEIKSNETNNGKILEDKKKHNKSKFSNFLPNFSDEKNSPCLRVPLGTALVVLGTIMTLACCCALLLRNRIAACFDRLRGKKNKGKTSKRMSADEEQGFMGPRTFGKPPVRSGRKGGGSTDVANVGIQNSNSPAVAKNGSKEFDERSTGCCNCCTRKKRKNKRKRKK